MPSTRYSPGETFTATVTADVSISSCTLTAWPPGSRTDGDNYYSYFFWGGAYETSVSVSFPFPADEPLGEWTFQIEATPWSNVNNRVSSSYYTVTVQ